MKHFDRLLFFIVIVIGIFGIVMIYSASAIWAEYKFQDPFKFVFYFRDYYVSYCQSHPT